MERQKRTKGAKSRKEPLINYGMLGDIPFPQLVQNQTTPTVDGWACQHTAFGVPSGIWPEGVQLEFDNGKKKFFFKGRTVKNGTEVLATLYTEKSSGKVLTVFNDWEIEVR